MAELNFLSSEVKVFPSAKRTMYPYSTMTSETEFSLLIINLHRSLSPQLAAESLFGSFIINAPNEEITSDNALRFYIHGYYFLLTASAINNAINAVLGTSVASSALTATLRLGINVKDLETDDTDSTEVTDYDGLYELLGLDETKTGSTTTVTYTGLYYGSISSTVDYSYVLYVNFYRNTTANNWKLSESVGIGGTSNIFLFTAVDILQPWFMVNAAGTVLLGTASTKKLRIQAILDSSGTITKLILQYYDGNNWKSLGAVYK